jgi:hypothetical protein
MEKTILRTCGYWVCGETIHVHDYVYFGAALWFSLHLVVKSSPVTISAVNGSMPTRDSKIEPTLKTAPHQFYRKPQKLEKRLISGTKFEI